MNSELNVQVAKALGYEVSLDGEILCDEESGELLCDMPDFSGDPTTFFKYVAPEILKQGYIYKYSIVSSHAGHHEEGVFSIYEDGKYGSISSGDAKTHKIAEAGCKAFVQMMEDKNDR